MLLHLDKAWLQALDINKFCGWECWVSIYLVEGGFQAELKIKNFWNKLICFLLKLGGWGIERRGLIRKGELSDIEPLLRGDLLAWLWNIHVELL